jgi:hypothetical protein
VNAEQALYEASEVKDYPTAFFTFFIPSFFVRFGIPFLRPDPWVLQAGARRDCQAGRRSALASHSIVSRPRLIDPGTAARSLWSG